MVAAGLTRQLLDVIEVCVDGSAGISVEGWVSAARRVKEKKQSYFKNSNSCLLVKTMRVLSQSSIPSRTS
jgi:hypothetical protein